MDSISSREKLDRFPSLQKEIDTDIAAIRAEISSKNITFFPDVSTLWYAVYFPFYITSRATVEVLIEPLQKYIAELQEHIFLVIKQDPLFTDKSNQNTCKVLQDTKLKIMWFQWEMEQVLHAKYVDVLLRNEDPLSVAIFREKLKVYNFHGFMSWDAVYAEIFLREFEQKCIAQYGEEFIEMIDDTKHGINKNKSYFYKINNEKASYDIICSDVGFIQFVDELKKVLPKTKPILKF